MNNHTRPLKTATRMLVQAVGGLEAAAAASGASTTRLAGYYDPTADDRMMRVDQVAALEACSPHPHVTAMLAALAGYRLVRQPQAAGCALRALANLLVGSGSVTAASAEAMADGRIDPAERARLLPVLERLAVLAAAAHATLSQAQAED